MEREQQATVGASAVDGSVAGAQPAPAVPGRSGGGGGNLPGGLRSGLERLSGLDMGDVNVHYGSAAPAQLGAYASARGNDIHLGPGQEHHLPHEAWHVVQQKRGDVAPTTQLKGIGVNDDSALEAEADEMGARAAQLGDTAGPAPAAPLRQVAAPTGAAQLAAPGAIQHVTNSCFVAAMINVFTVTPSLKNLLSPVANTEHLGAPAAELRNLLWRAVNTVDATQIVPASWVRNIMVSLVANGVIAHADDADDVNLVISAVVQRLNNGHADTGQANNESAFALVPWPSGTTVQQAFAAAAIAPPNSVAFNRTGGAAMTVPQAAPQQWNHGADAAMVTYRLTSAIERAEDYVDSIGNKAQHFISMVDRSGNGTEWWRSNDIGPSVTAIPDLHHVGGAPPAPQEGGPKQPKAKAQGHLAEAMAKLRGAVRPDSDDESDGEGNDAEDSWDDEPVVKPVKPVASDPVPSKEPVSASKEPVSASKEPVSASKEPGPDGGPPALVGGLDATTDAITYVYQRVGQPAVAGNNDQRVGNDGALDQQAFTARYMLNVANHQIALLGSDKSQTDRAISIISHLMLNPLVHERVASDKALFDKMYVSTKAPKPDKSFVFSTDPTVDKSKRDQRIHSIVDQLHYLLHRLGAGPKSLAHDKSQERGVGTEAVSQLTTTTAKEAQASTLAKLIALYAGEDVRLPVYTHRVGPMRARLTEQHASMTPEKYHETAAENLNAILTSKDAIGSNIRVTPADRGPGAYLSTDSDNFYGPHGFAFDPRDVHHMPLSKSLDNNHQHSSERTKEEHHQFRALNQPIPFVEGGKSTVAETFVGTAPEQSKDLPGTLKPGEFNAGVLPLTIESMIRNVLRTRLQLPAFPTQSHGSPEHDQPKTNEEVYLLRDLVIELEGLYEPQTWARIWQEAEKSSLTGMLVSAFDAMAKMTPKDDSKDKEKEKEKEKEKDPGSGDGNSSD